MKLSATIITLNEEKNIARAIKSLHFCDEIIIVDSFSTDRTVEVAQSFGAKVVQNKFLGYGQQKNYAASLCKNDWILSIDADEEVSEELKATLQHIASSNIYKCKLFRINRLTSFCGKWIYHGGWYPQYITRFGHKDYINWTEPNVHENLALKNKGEIGIIQEHLLHHSFVTVKSQVDTNIKYAFKGAKDLLQRKQRKPNLLELLFRPFGKFLECYFIKLGLLDGLAGFIIAINAAYSMFMKYTFSYMDKMDLSDD